MFFEYAVQSGLLRGYHLQCLAVFWPVASQQAIDIALRLTQNALRVFNQIGVSIRIIWS